MAEQMVQIRTVKQYFKEFIVENLKDKKKIDTFDLIPIKDQILDAFRKEIFGQIVFKLGPEAKTLSRDELAKIDSVHNILVQSFRKWRRLCILCGEYGLGSFFQLEDLQKVLTEDEKDPDEVIYADSSNDEGEDVTDKLDEILPPGEQPVYLEKETNSEEASDDHDSNSSD